MSVGGSSNLGTLLIRRLDTAFGVQASQQSQIVNAARSDAIAQLADASRVNPLQNETGRPLPESIEKAQAQVQRQARQPLENTRLATQPLPIRAERPAPETSATASAPTTLGRAAKTILALLSLFPEKAPSVAGRAPLMQHGSPKAGGTAGQAGPAAGQSGTVAQGSPPSSQTGAQPSTGSSTAAAAATSAPLSAAPAAPDGQAALFARALSLAVQQSGLFYESHLRELAFGGRTVAQLRLEPQGQLNQPGSSAPAQGGTAAQAAASQGAATPSESTAGTESRNANAGGTGATSSGQAAAAASTSSPALTGMHPDTQLVVRQQLEVLATQVFGWRGEAWPDAPMDWEVSRRDDQGLADEAGSHWATRLRLSLPQLGEVEARLSLHGSQIVMQLIAPQSAQTLAQNGPALRASFQEAGLTLSGLSIHQEEGKA